MKFNELIGFEMKIQLNHQAAFGAPLELHHRREV